MSLSGQNGTSAGGHGHYPAAAASSLNRTYGAYMIGTFIGLILYGISIHQSYRYGRLFPNDSSFMKLLVFTVVILETVHAVLNMHTCYFYLVTNYGNSGILNTGVWSLTYAPILISLVTLISQSFFARRVFLIGKQYRVTVGIAMAFYVAETSISAAAIYRGTKIQTIKDLAGVTHLVAAAFGTAIVGDALLAGALAYVVNNSRRGFTRRPMALVEVVYIYVINTGLLHGILNVLGLVIALSYPTFLYHGAVNVVTTRLYANILLAVLNSRQLSIANGVEIIDGGGAFGMNIIARANRLVAQERWNVPQVEKPSGPINVAVTTEIEGDREISKMEDLDMSMTDKSSRGSL